MKPDDITQLETQRIRSKANESIPMWLIWTAIITIVLLTCAVAYLYNRNKDLRIGKEKEKTEAERTAERKVSDSIYNEQKTNHATFVNHQGKKAAKALEIQKTTKYDKVNPPSRSYNAMLDSLSVAEPD